jgi:nucleotide-binding universal stress UspA family protein
MRILIGFNDTEHGWDALELGLRLAGSGRGTVTVATVYPDDDAKPYPTVGPSRGPDDHASRILDDNGRHVAEHKLEVARSIVAGRADVRYEVLGPSYASRALHQFAEKIGAHLLVVGSSGHAAIGPISPNSTVERLMHGATCPIAVAPRGYRDRMDKTAVRDIAVAYDGSEDSVHALELAVQIAHLVGGSLRLVTIARKPDDALRAKLDAVARELPADIKVTVEVVPHPDVAETLAHLPGDPPDLLVSGSHGYGLVGQILHRSVSSRLVRSAEYPVVVVPRGVETTVTETKGTGYER